MGDGTEDQGIDPEIAAALEQEQQYQQAEEEGAALLQAILDAQDAANYAEHQLAKAREAAAGWLAANGVQSTKYNGMSFVLTRVPVKLDLEKDSVPEEFMMTKKVPDRKKILTYLNNTEGMVMWGSIDDSGPKYTVSVKSYNLMKE